MSNKQPEMKRAAEKQNVTTNQQLITEGRSDLRNIYVQNSVPGQPAYQQWLNEHYTVANAVGIYNFDGSAPGTCGNGLKIDGEKLAVDSAVIQKKLKATNGIALDDTTNTLTAKLAETTSGLTSEGGLNVQVDDRTIKKGESGLYVNPDVLARDLTAGKGISIAQDVVSANIGSGLKFDENQLSVDEENSKLSYLQGLYLINKATFHAWHKNVCGDIYLTWSFDAINKLNRIDIYCFGQYFFPKDFSSLNLKLGIYAINTTLIDGNPAFELSATKFSANVITPFTLADEIRVNVCSAIDNRVLEISLPYESGMPKQ